MREYNIAVVGATGAVGEVIVEILEEAKLPIKNLYLLASKNSQGEKLLFNSKEYVVELLSEFDFAKADIAFFSAGSSVSKEYAPKAANSGCIVIDNTSLYRMDKDIPLVVPEVNPHAIADYKKRNIIANPNCSTIQMVVALKPIYDEAGITRVNVATYQSVSGTGKAAINELIEQSVNLLNGKELKSEVYPKSIAFNLLPQIDIYQDNGYTFEEMKMINETKKIFEDEDILVNATCVRVPVIYGHAEAITVETKERISADFAQGLLAAAPGITVMNSKQDGAYPTPFNEAAGENDVFVGRIRDDISCENSLNMWVVADNIRKGAALNSVQIAQLLIDEHLN